MGSFFRTGAVHERVSQRGYGTSSECVPELIREDQDRVPLRNLLLAGAASAHAAPADASYFEALRDRVRKAGQARRNGVKAKAVIRREQATQDVDEDVAL